MKPTLQTFFDAFRHAAQSVDAQTGRISGEALEQLGAARRAVGAAQAGIATPAAARPSPSEVARCEELWDLVCGDLMIDRNEVGGIVESFADLDAFVDPSRASPERKALERELRRASAPMPYGRLKDVVFDWDLSSAGTATEFPAKATVTLERPHQGRRHIVLELDPDRCKVDPNSVVATVAGQVVALDARNVRLDHGRLVLTVPPGTESLDFAYTLRSVSLEEGESGLLRSEDGKSFGTMIWPYHVGQLGPAISDPNDGVRIQFQITPPADAVVFTNSSDLDAPAYNGCMVVLHGYEGIKGQASDGTRIELWRRPGTMTADLEQAVVSAAGRATVFLKEKLGEFPIPGGVLRYIEGIYDGFSMEHDGLVSMSPSTLGDPDWAVEVAVHEWFHHVFGNSIRVKDWDFWMSEGFTSYWTYRMMEELEGPAAAERLFDRGADLANRSMSFNPHPLMSLPNTDVNTVFDRIPYELGAWMLRMIEGKLGRAEFDGLMKEFVAQFRGKPANTVDFAQFVSRHNTQGFDAVAFFDQWNALSQIPRARAENVRYDGNVLRMDVWSTTRVPAGLTLPVYVTLENGAEEVFELDISKRSFGFAKEFPSAVASVRFDPHETVLADVELVLAA